MRVSQRLDYVLRALSAMARLPEGTPVVAGELAAELRLPKRFLEQQLTLLGKRGIVSCQRGAGGGCALTRRAEEITVAEVVRAVQGEVLDVPHTSGSSVAEMWQEAAHALEAFLAGVTIADLARRQAELDAEAAPMYYI
ncbi:MAG: Rrf2 family transcriptional regulator [Coriobacteriia bacterium]|nr:Rrf2 family transcriptional regulator [Coriobacteriia bacterium]